VAADDLEQQDTILSGVPRRTPPYARREQMFPKLSASATCYAEAHGQQRQFALALSFGNICSRRA